MNIVQGIAISALLFVLKDVVFNKPPKDFYIWFKIVVSFLVICCIWHSYAVINQYVAWRFGAVDTIIPMSFAVFQILLVLSITKSIFKFSLFITILYLLGFIAYFNTRHRHDKPVTHSLYKEHFSFLEDDNDNNFSEYFFGEVKGFIKQAQLVMFYAFVIFSIVTGFIYYIPFSEKIYTIVVTILALFFLVFLLFHDLRYKLNHSEKLKNYGFQW